MHTAYVPVNRASTIGQLDRLAAPIVAGRSY
jgi:hypothetical protein